jgi:hypothetical protein
LRTLQGSNSACGASGNHGGASAATVVAEAAAAGAHHIVLAEEVVAAAIVEAEAMQTATSPATHVAAMMPATE